jgi:WD40 repeat protein
MTPRIDYEAFFKLDTGTHTDDIRQIVVTPDGKTLVTAGECTIRVWDAATRRLIRMLLGQVGERSEDRFGNGNVRRFALSPDGLWIVALKDWRLPNPAAGDAGRVTQVEVFELATGNLQAGFRYPGLLLDLDFSPDGRFLATGDFSTDPNIKIWDLASLVAPTK